VRQVQEEIEGIDIEKIKVKKANSALQKQIEESGMPEVLEYVTQKAQSHQLRKDLANYERKVRPAPASGGEWGVRLRCALLMRAAGLLQVEIGEMELRRTKTRLYAQTQGTR
jgi:hypothetical protein